MKIVVCIKQVPDTTEIKLDPVTGTMIRDGVPSIMNPDDKGGLEMALALKDKYGAQVTVITMGPPQADDILREAFAMGADRAIHLSDRKFAGADTLATSYTLKTAIDKIETLEGKFDIIFCGKQAIDGDTAQVGPEIAEHMDCPQITYAIEAKVENDEVLVKRETGEGYEVLAAKMPCVITVTKPSFSPRYPTIKSKMAANRATINTLTAADIPVDAERIGLKGSPTKVKKSFTPPQKQGGVVVKEDSPEASAQKLFELLNSAHIV